MTTSSSPLEQAIQALSVTGWYLHALGQGPYKSVKPWFAQLSPVIFGSHFQGDRVSEGGYTIYRNGMTAICGDGATALEAIQNARKALDSSPVKRVYQDLETAFMELTDALQARNSR